MVATYNRPDTLRAALRSVRLQTHRRWRVLVVGDRCDERTAAVVSAVGDERIDYLNLPVRCGEQAGPNAVGMALVETSHLAFLNHDDLLLSDHLEYGLGRLRAVGGDFFIGHAAATTRSADLGGERVPVFDGESHAGRHPSQAMYASVRLFEPASAWIVRTAAARAVGPWRRSADLYRTSLNDWVLRAWRARLRFAFGERITVIKNDTHAQAHYRTGEGSYNHDNAETAWLDRLVHEHPPEEVRRAIARDLAGGCAPGWSRPPEELGPVPASVAGLAARALRTRSAKAAYYVAGVDLPGLRRRLRGEPRQDRGRLVRIKTGESVSGEWTVASLVEWARAHRGEWRA